MTHRLQEDSKCSFPTGPFDRVMTRCRQAVGLTTCNWTGGEEHLALRSTLVEQIHVVLDELEREVGAVPVRNDCWTEN